jgi:hypothetical protein
MFKKKQKLVPEPPFGASFGALIATSIVEPSGNFMEPAKRNKMKIN